MEYALWFWDTA